MPTNFARNNSAVAGATIAAASYNANLTALETYLNSTGVGVYQDSSIDPSADINWSNNWTQVNVPLDTVQAFTASGSITRAGGRIVTFAGAASQTLTLPAAAAGLTFEIHNIDTADPVTIARAGSDTINGGTSIVLYPGDRIVITTVAAATWIASVTRFPYAAELRVQNSGAPTHNDSGNWQKVGDGGGTETWLANHDVRPSGMTAQVDTANGQIDIQRTGLYLVCWGVAFTTIADGVNVGAAVYLDGAQTFTQQYAVGGAAAPTITCSRHASLTAGSYLELYGYQNSGGAEEYTITGAKCFLSVKLIGPAS